MRYSKRLKRLLFIVAIGLLPLISVGQLALKFTPAEIGKIISQMTSEEKSLIVTGAKRRNVYPAALPGLRLKDIAGVGGYTYPFLKHGIPSIMLSDGPAGLRIAPRRLNDTADYYCTAFPVATLMACTWNVELAEKVGAAMGKEALEYGVDILLAPGMNIQRDPLGGRNFEYYSEDPYLTGKMAASLVRGIQSKGVGASIKHFAVNNQETNRRIIDAVVSERALREIYLEGFKIAVKEADPWTVMSSYNKINGVYTSESSALLDTILRKEWNFKGIVVSDWYAGKDPVAQVKAGNDLLMPGLQAWSDAIDSAISNKIIPESTINTNIARILSLVTKTATYSNYPFSNKPDLVQHAKLARMAASEGMVLLKNNTLPLKKTMKRVAAFGNYSYKLVPGGTGSGMVNNRYTVSTVQGLKAAGLKVDQELEAYYAEYLKQAIPESLKEDSLITAMPKPDKVLDERPLSTELIKKAAIENDIALITIMRVFGEGGDRNPDRSFHLTGEERLLIQKVSEAFRKKNKKTIVVLNVGGIIEMASWVSMVDVVLLAWQPGQEGGSAIADILTGNVNPSGKLSSTIPVKYEDVPTAKNFPGTPAKNPVKVIHDEDIYIGYRYFSTRQVKSLYEFGYGLSYTTFNYSNLVLDRNVLHDSVVVTVKITNAGKLPGKEIAQLYISAPAGELQKPALELKGFQKTRLLMPGESQVIKFIVRASNMASFHTKKSCWITEKGNYTFKIGASSNDIRLKKELRLDNDIVIEKVFKVLSPQP